MAEILSPGLVIGLTNNEACFFRMPLKSPSICLSTFTSCVDPPIANILLS